MRFDASDATGVLTELPEALLITSLEGEIVFANLALSSLTGFSSDELVGHDISKLLPTPERRRVQVIDWLSRWADDPDSEQLVYLNLELVTRAGDIRLVSVRVSRHREGTDTSFLVMLRDVTRQHETVAQLRHAQLVTNRMLAIGADAVLSIDPDQRISYWNAAAEDLFGYAQSEVLGQPLSMLLPAGLAERHRELAAAFAAGTEASKLMGNRGEITGRHKDGHLMPLEASITKTTIDGETFLSAQVRDISERKERQRLLRESEARFRAIFENAIEAMALLSKEGRVLEINAAARHMLPSFDAEAMFWELDWWGTEEPHEEARTRLRGSVGRCAAGEVIRTRVNLSQGSQAREIDFSLIPVHDTGIIKYIIAEGRDITPEP